MTKRRSLIKVRKPRLRLTRKGLKVENVGVSVGGKAARVNLSRGGDASCRRLFTLISQPVQRGGRDS